MEPTQKSSEWHTQRLGRFTGSRISELLGIKGLGETGKSYAFENAVEIVYGRDEEEQFLSYDLKRGTELEPLAFRKFKEIKATEFIDDVQECGFFAFGKDAGASPDGLVGKDAVIEIKCPRSNKFFKLVAEGIDVIDKSYIAQMQMEMLCTNSVRCHFFNYIIYNGVEMWHELVIERDEVMINLIKLRIIEATKIRDQYVEELRKNAQFKL